MDDLTPVFTVLPADQEIVQPVPMSAAGSQPVGGFVASPTSLTQGAISINGTAQTILIGAATTPTNGIGIFMGSDGQLSPGYDFRVGDPSGHYIWWDASAGTLSIVGAVSASSINIPDTTTTNSFHVDSSGNTWWGSNVAAGLSAALASIDSQGNAIFKSVSIGGTAVQYVITNSGIFSYGDGSDGSAHITTSVTLTADKYYTDLTVDSGGVVDPGGYRIFVSGTLTLGGSGTGVISRNGGNGGNGVAGGSGSQGGTGGTGFADGYLKGSLAGAAGGNGGGGTPFSGGAANGGNSAGTSTSNSIGSNGSAGGSGGGSAGGAGSGGGSTGASGGSSSGGTATVSNVKLIANWHLATMLDITSSGSTIKFDNSASSGGGAGGANGGGNSIGLGNGGGVGGGGGGAGGTGGIIAIYARNIVINANGSISANGGNGGNGANASNASGGGGFAAGGGGGGGGGAGGNGGQIILTYNQLSGAGTSNITANGGTAGTGGSHSLGINGGGAGGDGAAGTNGIAGNVREFQLSL